VRGNEGVEDYDAERDGRTLGVLITAGKIGGLSWCVGEGEVKGDRMVFWFECKDGKEDEILFIATCATGKPVG
jgi:hypothetical protein